jgi:ATP/maltotriose-dependent transcriptional regulator MalT
LNFSVESANQALFEPLTERELEVLAYLATGMTNQDIAGELYVSLAAVKWHARNIYSKLEVKNRTQAVAKARELGLLQ